MENKIKELRKSKSLSLEKLGKLSGVTRSHIWQLETSHSDPSIRLAYAISKTLGSTIDNVFPDPNKYKKEVKEFISVV